MRKKLKSFAYMQSYLDECLKIIRQKPFKTSKNWSALFLKKSKSEKHPVIRQVSDDCRMRTRLQKLSENGENKKFSKDQYTGVYSHKMREFKA